MTDTNEFMQLLHSDNPEGKDIPTGIVARQNSQSTIPLQKLRQVCDEQGFTRDHYETQRVDCLQYKLAEAPVKQTAKKTSNVRYELTPSRRMGQQSSGSKRGYIGREGMQGSRRVSGQKLQDAAKRYLQGDAGYRAASVASASQLKNIRRTKKGKISSECTFKPDCNHEPIELIRNQSPGSRSHRGPTSERSHESSIKYFKKPLADISTLPKSTWREEQILADRSRNPHKYRVLCQQLGLSDEEVFRLKEDQVNYEIEKWMKKKGLEYLRDKNGLSRADELPRSKHTTEPQQYRLNTIREVSSKKLRPVDVYQYSNQPNPISDAFAGMSKKKRGSSSKEEGGRPSLSKKIRLLRQLNDKEEMLGKIVFQRVKKHLNAEKEAINYFNRVNSEQSIDDALIKFLKTKINRAETALK